MLRIEACLGRRVLKPKCPGRRRGGWFPSPDDGSQTIANLEEKKDGHQEDSVEGYRNAKIDQANSGGQASGTEGSTGESYVFYT